MAPILPERRRATASCGCAGRFAVPARAHCDDVRPSHRDVLNKKSARRGTDTKTVRIVTSTTPGAIVIVCRASIQYGFLGKLRVCGIACISLHRAAAGMSCHRVLRMAGPRRRDRYRQRRPRNDFVPQRHRCLVGRIRLRHCHGHDAEAVVPLHAGCTADEQRCMCGRHAFVCTYRHERERAGERKRCLQERKQNEFAHGRVLPICDEFSEMHAIAPQALSRLRLRSARCESRSKVPENVSGLKRWGLGILRIQSIRFKDENRRVCRCRYGSLPMWSGQMIDERRPLSDSAARPFALQSVCRIQRL